MRKTHPSLAIALLLCASACAFGGDAEVPPPTTAPCFAGAYYRKAVSSMDKWSGIEGVVTLPQITWDESRRQNGNGRRLDNPSIYVGGRSATHEIDCGVTWSVIKEADGSVSKDGKAFRVFWRNEKWFNAPAQPEYYYYPGDTIRISCTAPAEGKLRIQVDLLSRAGQQPAAPATRPISTFSTEFDAVGFGPGQTQQFKRVNAIDQVGREKKDVDATRCAVIGAHWREVWLVRGETKLAFVPRRFTDMRCPDEAHVAVEIEKETGAERLSLYGDPSTNKTAGR